MPLSVQNDNGTNATANGYVDVAFADAYWNDRNPDADWLSLSVVEKDAAIIESSDFVDYRYQYKGYRRAEAQTTEFPRYDLYDSSGWEVRGIPIRAKHAVCELANIAAAGVDLVVNPTYDPRGTVKAISEKVDVLAEQVQFAVDDSGRRDPGLMPQYPIVHRLLREYTRGGARRHIRRG